MFNIENPIKIIVVSPDILMVEYLQTILDASKFIVNPAKPTPEGVAATRRVNPALYLIDDTGDAAAILSTCQIIRQYSCMPIMVLSSQRKTGLVEQILDAGADEFLLKPVPGSVLIAHLNTLARRVLAERDAALSIVRGETETNKYLGLLTY